MVHSHTPKSTQHAARSKEPGLQRYGWMWYCSRLTTHLLEHFYFGAEALDGLVVLAFEVICETCACIGRGV